MNRVVSIVTPLYNGATFISDTIRSVQDQTYTLWQMIIVDDCSTDNSASIVQAFSERDHRIKLIQMDSNKGAAEARNAAIHVAEGRFIAFLDSDDLWLPEKLEAQVAFMDSNGLAFSFSAYQKIDEKNTVLGFMGVPRVVKYGDLLKCCVIGCLTAMYDTELVGKVYMPLIRKRQDFGLWLRLLKKVDFAYGIQEPLAQYRVRPGSISEDKRSAAAYTWRLYRDVEDLGFLPSSYYFIHYAVRGVLRQKFPKLARKVGVLD